MTEAEQALQDLRRETDYLLLEVSRLRSIVRYLSAGRTHEFPILRATADSFDFQWASTRDGNWTETRPELKARERAAVLQFTQLPEDWFAGKKVLDAGCGSGRFSYALASLGANVTAVDLSPAGVGHTQKACAEFDGRVRVQQHNLTQPLPFADQFDLIWSFGVLHHTGNTHGAYSNIARAVRPGGYLFMMLYGEPETDPGSYDYYVEVERLRRATAAMSFQERYAYMEKVKGAEAGGWFDAASPGINDTYSFFEIAMWLKQDGFVDVRRTVEHPSHHVIARKS